jgi:predicted nuclease of predicted toxin-antitoxin system
LKFWLDAQFSPALAEWLTSTFQVEAVCVQALGLCEAEDSEIFAAARQAGAIVVTKDRDFVYLVERLGVPPQILWVTVGNTSKARMLEVFSSSFPDALVLLQEGEPLVELGDAFALRR